MVVWLSYNQTIGKVLKPDLQYAKFAICFLGIDKGSQKFYNVN